MSENILKGQFLNFLLKEKYKIAEEKNPIIENHLARQNAPKILREFSSKKTPEDVSSWIAELESSLPFTEEITNDLAFGVLYSSDVFIKMYKSKNRQQSPVFELYKAELEKNKKYIIEFSKKDQTKLKISVPKRITTRFPPEPSGYLHIGHAKAALLNQHLADEGQLIVRFDDTNPLKETKEFEEAILDDLKLLKITDFKLTRSSDNFDLIFDYACQLIKEGKAYVDNTDLETMRQQRTDGIASKNRDLPSEESLRIFNGMSKGEYKDYCLRAKISIDDPNKAMRDPVIYRHVDIDHQSTGCKYRIYPTYDFTVPILDSHENITLTLRTNEYRDRNAQYYWFIENLHLSNKPTIHDFSRLNFENTVISKRKMKFYVNNKFVSGWDDPRMSTLRGLVRLGMNMDALREYIISQGCSQKTSVVSWDKIWALNKKMIDPLSARFSAVPLENAVACRITSSSCSESPLEISADKLVDVLKHKKNPSLGMKKLLLSDEILLAQDDASLLKENEEFTLMNWGNAIVQSKSIENGTVKSMEIKLNLDGDFKTTKNKINWVSRKGSVHVKLFEYGNLQNDLETDDLAEKFNKESKKESWYVAESSIKDTIPGQYIQFERIGFFYCDGFYDFNLIPFTKQKRNE